jgi:hypothetical protein
MPQRVPPALKLNKSHFSYRIYLGVLIGYRSEQGSFQEDVSRLVFITEM